MDRHEKNKKDFIRISKKKYFFKQLLEDIKSFIKKEKSLAIRNKINRIPVEFLEFFNQESYLIVNPKIKKNALEHFIFYGYDDVRSGKRRIGKAFPFMSEAEYLEINPDLKEIGNRYSSVFEHFLSAGYQEFLVDKRKISSRYPFHTDKKMLKKLKNNFDINAYLEANPDSSWEHFISDGLKDVQQGKRTLHNQLPKISESQYIQSNPDILEVLNSGEMKSAFTHYLLNGYQEM